MCQLLCSPNPAQGTEGAEGDVAASEREWSDLQWRKFDVVARGASDTDRRTYRSLLFNLTTQRQLLRQVSAAGGGRDACLG